MAELFHEIGGSLRLILIISEGRKYSRVTAYDTNFRKVHEYFTSLANRKQGIMYHRKQCGSPPIESNFKISSSPKERNEFYVLLFSLYYLNSHIGHFQSPILTLSQPNVPRTIGRARGSSSVEYRKRSVPQTIGPVFCSIHRFVTKAQIIV